MWRNQTMLTAGAVNALLLSLLRVGGTPCPRPEHESRDARRTVFLIAGAALM